MHPQWQPQRKKDSRANHMGWVGSITDFFYVIIPFYVLVGSMGWVHPYFLFVFRGGMRCLRSRIHVSSTVFLSPSLCFLLHMHLTVSTATTCPDSVTACSPTLRSVCAPTLELDPRQACASSSSSTRVDIYSRLRVVATSRRPSWGLPSTSCASSPPLLLPVPAAARSPHPTPALSRALLLTCCCLPKKEREVNSRRVLF